MKIKGCVLAVSLAFAGCVTSPFLSENAAERLAAVDALADQRKLAEVALDYCTEPYQELPTGCQMDVRVRAVERLSDRDLLMAVASFSIVKAAVRGQSCQVTLGEPNSELRKLALEKLTEGKYIPSVLAAKDPFAIQPLFSKALFGYYQIAGQPPATAKDAWLATAKGKEKSVAKAFCDCIGENIPTELCQQVYALLPASPSAETKESIKASYKQLVVGATSVNAAVRTLQLAAVVPADAVVKEDIDAMCKNISSKVSTIGEFTSFGSLVNGEAKKYLADPESLIKDAATQVVPKLNGMDELSAFAGVLKTSSSLWIGQIGIEDAVRKCAASVNNIGGIKVFAGQLASFNTVMLPNKTDIAGDAVIAVLNAVVEGKAVASAAPADETQSKGRKGRNVKRQATQPGQKESIDDFVVAVTAFPADLLSDKAIVAIITNNKVISAYESALRHDGVREEMGNELTGAAMRSGSFGDMLVAGMLMGSMGDKQSPKFNNLYSRLLKFVQSQEAIQHVCASVKNLSIMKLSFAEVQGRFDSMCLAKCIISGYPNFTDSRWFREITLTSGERFVFRDEEQPLSEIQSVIEKYIVEEKGEYLFRAAFSLNDPVKIEAIVFAQFGIKPKEIFPGAGIRVTNRPEVENKYFPMMLKRINDLYKKSGNQEKCNAYRELLAKTIAGLNFIYNPSRFGLDRVGENLFRALGEIDLRLLSDVVCLSRIEPISHDFGYIVDLLSKDPHQIVAFLVAYSDSHKDPYYVHGDPKKETSGIRHRNSKQLHSWQDNNHNWVKYCPYYGFDLESDLPVRYFDCEWYWKAACKASAMDLGKEDRKSLNEIMKMIALNALNLDARQTVFDSIKGDADKQEIKDAWAKSTENARRTDTDYVRHCLDTSKSDLKKEIEWAEKYLGKRIRFVGKFMDVEEKVGSHYEKRIIMKLNLMDELLETSCLTNGPYWVDGIVQMKLETEAKLHNDAEAKKKLKWLNETSVVVVELEVPEIEKEAAMSYSKGDDVVFEAYPEVLKYQRSDRSEYESLAEGRRTFVAKMRHGRLIKEK